MIWDRIFCRTDLVASLILIWLICFQNFISSLSILRTLLKKFGEIFFTGFYHILLTNIRGSLTNGRTTRKQQMPSLIVNAGKGTEISIQTTTRGLYMYNKTAKKLKILLL